MSQQPLLSPHSRAVELDDEAFSLDPSEQPPFSHPVPRVEPEELDYFPIEEDTFVPTTLNLSKAILGAAVMVIPRVFGMVGCVVGLGFLALVAAMTWFTISCLIYSADKTGKTTYAQVVLLGCGRTSKWVLLFSVVVNCWGLIITYLIVIGDVLCGESPAFNGIIHELLPHMDPATHWWMQKPAVLALLCCAVLTPLTTAVRLESLGAVNMLGVGSVVVFGVATMACAAAALAHGTAHTLPLWPTWSRLGGSPLAVAAGLANILPILLNANVCHQAVFPLLPLLRPYKRSRMNRVAGVAVGACNVLYALIALSCVAAFGSDLDADVLKHMSVSSLTPLLGGAAAMAVSYVVRTGYVVSLVGSATLAMHPLRHCCMEVLLGVRYHTLHLLEEHLLFLPLTAALLGGAFAAAVLLPGIWIVMSLVGSVGATLMGFVFPSLVALVYMRKPKPTHTARRVAAVVTLATGVFLFFNGFSVFVPHA